MADSAYNYNAAGDRPSLVYTRATGPNHTSPVSVASQVALLLRKRIGRTVHQPSHCKYFTSLLYLHCKTVVLGPLGISSRGARGLRTYTYDANGNRTMSGYVTSGNNRLLSDGTYTYEYDAEGHRTRQTDIATGVVVEYTWDYRSRLTQLTFKDANGSETKLVRYTYDAFDRRIRKEVNADGNGTYESSESYVYDGSNIVLVADETGSLTNRYLHGPAVDQILADEQISSSSQTPNEVLWALTDNQGSVRDFVIRDATTGQTLIIDHLVYDAYGQIVAHTNPQQGGIASTRDIHYAYTGREWDADANLYFYRARWYDAHAGRFISEDPLGFAAGDTNVQRYVGNSSTNAKDPSGLVGLDLKWIDPNKPLLSEAQSWLDRAKAAYAMEQSGKGLPIGEWSSAKLLRQARNAYNMQNAGAANSDSFVGNQNKLDYFISNPGIAGNTVLYTGKPVLYGLKKYDEAATFTQNAYITWHCTSTMEKWEDYKWFYAQTYGAEKAGKLNIYDFDPKTAPAHIKAETHALTYVAEWYGGNWALQKGFTTVKTINECTSRVIGTRKIITFTKVRGGATVRVYRVEGTPNTRVLVGENGEIVIVAPNKTLYLNFGDKARAEQYLAQKLSPQQKLGPLPGAEVKSFEVPKSFVDELRASAVTEAELAANPALKGRPLVSDPTMTPDSLGLRPEQIECLKNQIIQGSGRTGLE